MPLYRKTSCAQCSHYTDCSLATRLFINYCGARSKAIDKKIDDAFAECRERQGYFFRKNLQIHLKDPLSSALAIVR